MKDDIQSLSHSKWRCQYHIQGSRMKRMNDISKKNIVIGTSAFFPGKTDGLRICFQGI